MNLIQDLLESEGYDVASAQNGQEAFDLFMESPFLVVITDINMPIMDGNDLITKLKSNVTGTEPAIIVETVHNEPKYIIDIIKKGIFDYLNKPINMDDLIVKVQRAFDFASLKRTATIIEKVRIIRLQNHLRELEPETTRESDEDDKTKDLAYRVHTIFNQGAGIGTLVSLFDYLLGLAKEACYILFFSVFIFMTVIIIDFLVVQNYLNNIFLIEYGFLLIVLLMGKLLIEDLLSISIIEKELAIYRNKLEDLVEERTNELNIVIKQLKLEIEDNFKKSDLLDTIEERFMNFADLIPEMIFESDQKGDVTFLNKAALAKSGYSKNDITSGLNALQFIVPEDHSKIVTNLKKTISGETIKPNEYMALRKDGTTFPIRILSSPIYKDGDIKGIRGIIIDITDQKVAEKKILQSMHEAKITNRLKVYSLQT